MSRPQIGIERLPIRRLSNNEHRLSNEPKQVMNCKSCRRRKIKCNRLRPSCEACLVFKCACVYDAVPKKRGPKTDAAGAGFRKANGLESRPKLEQHRQASTTSAESPEPLRAGSESSQDGLLPHASPRQQSATLPQTYPPPAPLVLANQEALAFTAAFLDTYFARLHANPYYILDEVATRQRLRDGRLPSSLINAVHALTIRYVPHLCGGYQGALQASRDYATRSRSEINVDEPSIDNIQALLLLSIANHQNGRGQSSQIALNHAINMAILLNLHRELPLALPVTHSEREGRRKLFWTCYIMDRLSVTGSNRPSLIPDEAIKLRLPAGLSEDSQLWQEGSHFQSAMSSPPSIAHAKASALVEIAKILGITNRYMSAGGMKGDTHFPWHAQSTLFKIKGVLDHWAVHFDFQDTHDPTQSVFGHAEGSIRSLSKMIYHVIHCLIYRSFLPIDASGMSESDHTQSWRGEAISLAFSHANAIAAMTETSQGTSMLDWPSFVGYCICTAGTIHVHGSHYAMVNEHTTWQLSDLYLRGELAQLHNICSSWVTTDHQLETLQRVSTCHSQLVQLIATRPMQTSPAFQMETFFNRYPGACIDGSYSPLIDASINDRPSGSTALETYLYVAEPLSEQVTHHKSSARTQASPSLSNLNRPMVDRRSSERPSSSGSAYRAPTPVELVTASHESRQSDMHVTAIANATSENRRWPPGYRPQPSQSSIVHRDAVTAGTERTEQHRSIPTHAHEHPGVSLQSHIGQGHHFHTSSGTARSVDSTDVHANGDPFLNLLEQMADTHGFDLNNQFDFPGNHLH